MEPIAIIGGTGVYDPHLLEDNQLLQVNTRYGTVSCMQGYIKGQKVIFMTRHGQSHSIPPHKINYRANILALKRLGVKTILATTAVGSLNPAHAPGDFVIADQFIDFTKNRIGTFFEGADGKVVHVDVTEPYCPSVRQTILQAAASLDIPAHIRGTYVCTEGPRFETPAEIQMFRLLGGDLVGMTSVPEVTLAREAEMCYANISMVTNFAAGISPVALTHGEVLEVMKKNEVNLQRLILATFGMISGNADCKCHSALHEYGGFHLHETN